MLILKAVSLGPLHGYGVSLRIQEISDEELKTQPGGVQTYVVIAMKPRYEGEARHAILATMACNLHPKWVIVIDPDIDIRKSTEVE